MRDFKQFTGKTVDEAIEEAGRYFGVGRDKMEIEILSGGSTGIFGLVGKKKAEIKARVRGEASLDINSGSIAAEKPLEEVAPSQEPKQAEQPRQAAQPKPARPRNEPQAKSEPAPKPEPAAQPESTPARSAAEPEAAQPAPVPLELTPELAAIIRAIVDKLLSAILETTPELEITGEGDRVGVLILDEENSGLLIGREGQTLAALQYLVNRIVARQWQTPVRVQINTGEYRQKQDDNLRKMAIYLAEKAKSAGRPQSTKPLSSYHRRVVHMALQDDESIQTRSKGEGPLKRVIILPRRQKQSEAQQQSA